MYFRMMKRLLKNTISMKQPQKKVSKKILRVFISRATEATKVASKVLKAASIDLKEI